MSKTTSLHDAYRHPGFMPALRARTDDDDPDTFWVALRRRRKKTSAEVADAWCKATLKDVAHEMDLHWTTVKDIDKLYRSEQLIKAGPSESEAIGIDEISIGPGHTYRIVVSDLLRKRAIWFGGTDRSEASMDLFF